jgi:xanthine/CO dehydrogenase XdhC/CoxF family maturation factor
MPDQEEWFVIVIGDNDDWQTGRGSLYYIEEKHGERAMPVFTSAEKAEDHFRANLTSADAHMQMLEKLHVTHVPELTEGKFGIASLPAEPLVTLALSADINYLVRDPRPGAQQEVIRLDT